MKYVYIDRRTIPSKTNVVHRFLFHGVAKRAGIPALMPQSLFFPSPNDSPPLKIDISNFSESHIIMPELNLVVSEKVKEILEIYHDLSFGNVQFDKVVNCWYEPGDFSYHDKYRGIYDPDLFFDQFAKATCTKKKFFELQVTNAYNQSNLAPAIKITVDSETETTIKFPWDPSSHGYFNFFWAKGVFIKNEVFDKLIDFFDWRFFSKKCIDL